MTQLGPPLTSTTHLDFSATKDASQRRKPMPPLKDPMQNPGQSRSPALAASLAVFAAGLVVGLGMVANLGGQFVAGLIIFAVLSAALALLQRVAENTRK